MNIEFPRFCPGCGLSISNPHAKRCSKCGYGFLRRRPEPLESINKIENELNALKMSNSQLEAALDAKNNELNTLKMSNSQLEAALGAKNNELNTLKMSNSQLEAALDAKDNEFNTPNNSFFSSLLHPIKPVVSPTITSIAPMPTQSVNINSLTLSSEHQKCFVLITLINYVFEASIENLGKFPNDMVDILSGLTQIPILQIKQILDNLKSDVIFQKFFNLTKKYNISLKNKPDLISFAEKCSLYPLTLVYEGISWYEHNNEEIKLRNETKPLDFKKEYIAVFVLKQFVGKGEEAEWFNYPRINDRIDLVDTDNIISQKIQEKTDLLSRLQNEVKSPLTYCLLRAIKIKYPSAKSPFANKVKLKLGKIHGLSIRFINKGQRTADYIVDKLELPEISVKRNKLSISAFFIFVISSIILAYYELTQIFNITSFLPLLVIELFSAISLIFSYEERIINHFK